MHTPEQKKESHTYPVRLLFAAAGGILLALLPADTVQGAQPLAPVCAANPQPAGAAGAQWFPRDPQFALQAARDLLARPDYPSALCYLESVRPLIAEDPAGLVVLGDAYWGGGRTAEAVRTWEQARAAGNGGDEVLHNLTAGYVLLEQWDPAAQLLAEWLARHPEDGAAAFRLALIRAAQEPESALDLLAALAETTSPEAEPADVLVKIIRAAAALEEPAYLHARTGEELIQLGEPALAEIAMRKALALNPEYGEAYALLGLAQESAGRDPGNAYRRAAQTDPDSVIVCLLYGSWLERTGNRTEARDWLTRAWEKKPGDSAIAASLARTEFAAGNPGAAEDWLLEAVRMFPEDSSAWQALAAFYIENDLRVETDGIPAARQAVLLAPKDSRAVDLFGLAWFRTGDLPEAERILRQAAALDPSNALVRLHLGMCLLELGRTDEAAAELRLAVELDPRGAAGAQARALLAGGG